jgi:S1-C subfamily serine protease
MAVDLLDDRLVPVATGSGTIITRDGSILTNHHVIYDNERKRLHDVFVVGLLRTSDGTTELVCAGHPDRSKLEPELDLALIKCDMDMDGQHWFAGDWPTAKIDMNQTAVLGERIWIAGYPETHTGMVSLATGEVSGSTREGTEIDYIKTTATITPGNSGGAAVDETGLFIGIPTAYRLRTRFDGMRASDAGQVGLIRPIQRARHLVDIAQKGWQPRHADAPPPPPPPDPSQAERGVLISSVVRDAANDRPVADAMITVFKAGIKADDVDVNKLHEQALTWASANSEGSFTLRARLPRGASYTVAITARGYRPLIESDILILDANSPEYFDPWGYIRLER